MRNSAPTPVHGGSGQSRSAQPRGPYGLIALGLAAVLTVLTLAQIAAARPPYLALRLKPCDPGPFCVSWLMAGGQAWDAGLRGEDQVLRVVDPIPGAAGAARAVEVPTGTGTRVVSADVAGAAKGAARWSLPALGLLFVGLGSLVLVRRPGLRAARSFWVFTVAVGLATAVAPASGGTGPAWSLAVQFLSLLLVFWSLHRFFNDLSPSYPRLSGQVRRASIAALAVLAVAYGATVLWAPNAYPTLQAATLLYFGALLALSLASLVIGYRRAATQDQRSSIAIVASSTVLGFSPVLFLDFLPLAAGTGAIVQPEFAALGLAAIPLGFVLSIRLFGIRRLVRRGTVYLALSGLLLLTIMLLLALGANLRADWFDVRQNGLWVVGGAVVVGALLFSAIRPLAHRLADRYIYRDSYDYGEAVGGLARGVRVGAQPQDATVALLERVRSLMGIEGYLLTSTNSGKSTVLAAGGPAAGRLQDALESGAFAPQEGAAIRFLDGEPVLALRLSQDDALLLGPKPGGDSFRDDDVRLAEPLGSMVAMLLARSRLAEELRELYQRLVTAQEEERRRLALEVHDGPLQTAVYLSKATLDAPQVAETARSLATELRSITTTLRPPALDDLGLYYALDWLVNAASDGLEVEFEASEFPEDSRLPPAIELALYRTVQEALTNVRKHSGATRAALTLALRDGRVIAEVSDNGKGIDPVKQREAARDGHLGLVGIRERLRQVGGELRIESGGSGGTTLEIVVPFISVSLQPSEVGERK